MGRVISGVCSLNLMKTMLSDVNNLAWVLTPIQSYDTQVQEITETCLFKLRQGLEKVKIESVKDLAAVLKVYETFDKRLHGDYVQKKEVKLEGSVEQINTSNINIANELTNLGISNDEVRKVSYIEDVEGESIKGVNNIEGPGS